MSMVVDVALRVEGVRKSYGPAVVLDGVSLDLRGGRVDGLIGRNGAGKSTLVNVLTGRTDSDAAEIAVDGALVEIRGPADALAAGIVAVPQELVMPMDMTVAEVVTFGAEPGHLGLLDLRAAEREVRELLGSMGLDIDVRARVADLPVSWQKVVMVAQALHRNARILILDEPTAAMNADDCDRVLEVVRGLRERGLAVLYISHRFDEVVAICDRVTAMADGRVLDVMEEGEVTHARLVEAITGSDAGTESAGRRSAGPRNGDSLTVTGLRTERLHGIDLEVRPGEIVGIAGLPGSGVEDVFQVVAARRRPDGGRVALGDAAVTSPRVATRLGIGLLPASRADAALISEPVIENLSLPALGRIGRFGVFTLAAARRGAAPIIEKLSLRPVADRLMGQLSGGNQQRVLVGAKLLAAPRFLLLEDPTVGVDVAARAELHGLLWRLADDGMGLLVGSSDPEELLGLCDRIVAMHRGRVVAEWPAREASEPGLLAAITGSGDGHPS
jgi:ABC-type sugar transport system ATPase subunit